MKEVHLTNASIPGVRCLREIKASTNKRRRDTTYTSKRIEKTTTGKRPLSIRTAPLSDFDKAAVVTNMIGNRMATPVRTAEATHHSIASSLEGKVKNRPAQCIPPNTPPTTDIQMTRGAASRKFSHSGSVA